MNVSNTSPSTAAHLYDDASSRSTAAAAPAPSATESSSSLPRVLLGGTGLTKRPAFCLLDGFQDDDGSRATFPIHRLPATLGRTLEDSADRNFISMGAFKFLSRQHVQIRWLVPTSGGGCGQMQSKKQKAGDNFYFNIEHPVVTSEIIQAGDNQSLPDSGFFAITCLGKNRITVNGQRLEQGQTCWLEPGAAVRIGGFALYFLTPLDPPVNTMEVRDDVGPAPASTATTTTTTTTDSPSNKKARRISLSTGGGDSSKVPSLPTSAAPATTSSSSAVATVKKGGGGPSSQRLQNELDQLSTKELLKQMQQGIRDNVWDRRHQVIGATLSYRAVLAATRSPELQQVAEDRHGELARSEIMEWIAESERFQTWNEHMQSKMELKSFQSSITKALIKAGFERNSAHGRYIKWRCPPDIYTPRDDPQQQEHGQPNEEEEGGDDDDGRASEDDDQDDDDEEEGDGSSDDDGGDHDNDGDRPQYQSGEDQEGDDDKESEDENSLPGSDEEGMAPMEDAYGDMTMRRAEFQN